MQANHARRAEASPTSKASWHRKEVSASTLSVLINLPTLLLVTFVLFIPVCFAVYLSLTKINIGALRRGFPFPFVGLDNFANLFADPLFIHSIKNTFLFAGFTVVFEVVLGLGIALLIVNRRIWISRLTDFLILLPYGVPYVANGLIWVYIYNSQFGFLNRFLINIGVIDSYRDWFGNTDLIIFLIAVPYIWRTLPFTVLLFVAALMSIPKDYYEAAQIDGAGYWQSFFWIALPLLRPVLAIVVILRTTFAFLVFDEVLAITQGGPGDATWVASWYAFKKSFEPPFAIGLGSAASFVVALLLFVLAIIYVKTILKRGYQ
jgi:multiple sugar transport system permease protein